MIFDLSVVDKNILKITGRPFQEGEDDSWEESQLMYTVGSTINVIKYKPSNQENPEILDVLIAPHDKEYCESLHTFTKDGHYIIDHLLIMSLEAAKECGVSAGYCTDGETIYKLIDGKYESVPVEELLEVNDESVYKMSQETFSICYLHECYLELCNNKFKQLMRNRCNKKEDVEDFNLDLIGLSLSAIRYNLEFGYMDTAQSIVEDLYRCTNICKMNIKHECGCCN